MTLDEHIARAKELIATREEIDQQLAQLFAGIAPAKKTTRCKVCSELGHIAKTRPTKPAAAESTTVTP